MNMFGENAFPLLMLIGGLAFMPLVAITVTAFAKIAIVLFVLRNALGVQQLPPNMVVYGLSLILSTYIALPILDDAYRAVQSRGLAFDSFQDWLSAASVAVEPLKAFLKRFADSKQLSFFVESASRIWGERTNIPISGDSLAVLMPAFLLTELTKAFQIGFMLYLPFMAIDIAVTTILVALGMMQIQPNTIAVPFKLLLFVTVEGWTKIVQGLVMTYI